MISILLGGHLLLAIAIVALVLLQQGRGADAGAVFGGSSQGVFGSRGPATFLSRITALLATIFFLNCLLLAYLYNRDVAQPSVTTTPSVLETPSELPGLEAPVVPENSDGQPAAAVPTPSDVPEVPATSDEQQQ